MLSNALLAVIAKHLYCETLDRLTWIEKSLLKFGRRDMQQVSKLTVQQESLLPEYKKKWQLAALSTQTIDKQKAIRTIKAVYKQVSNIDIDEFDIYFFKSPVEVANLSFLEKVYPQDNWCNPKKLNNLIRRIENRLLTKCIGRDFWQHNILPLLEIVGKQIDIKLWHYLEKELHFWSPLSIISANLNDAEKLSEIWKSAKPNQKRRLEGLWFKLASPGLVTPDGECSTCCLLDYCISELNCIPEEHLWQMIKTFVSECGWTFFYQDFCFVCARPYKIVIDNHQQIYSENEAIIEFSDGFKIFSKNGNSITLS